jgi:carbon-monoxide dehydrogenase medium subunit
VKLFDYTAPATLHEALAILGSGRGETRTLAGGTDLIAQMKEGRRTPDVVLDIKRIPECMRLAFERDGLHIGAAVTCTALIGTIAVRERYPILAQGASLIGSVQIQNRAGLGGNLCNAAPSADGIPGLICLGAQAVIAGPKGRRVIPAEHFCTEPGKTVLGGDELLVEIVVPPPPPESAGAYMRFIPRAEMDIAVAGAGSFVTLDRKTGRCKEARIVLAAVAPTPIRARAAEQSLAGQALTMAAIAKAGELAMQAAQPISDVRSSKEYRLELVQVLTRRTLADCAKSLGVPLSRSGTEI